MLRSVGLEPAHPDFTRRKKLLLLLRLIPLVEANYNLIELGPRGTGKSFVYREISPYAILVSGGQTTVAQLFMHMGSGQMGLVGLWDTVAFDEVAGVRFKDPNGIQILKDYMESGSFSRGKEETPAEAAIVFNGNLDGDVATLVKTSHLLQPLSDDMKDLALIDRIHFYLPGWELDKMRPDYFTGHYGFVVDYISEVWRSQRKTTYSDALDRHFSLGSHLNQRDVKATRKTVSGLIKLLHPDGHFTRDELQEYLELGAGRPAPRQRAVAAHGRAGVLGGQLLVPRPGDPRRDLRRRARTIGRRADHRWPAGSRHHLHRRHRPGGRPPGHLPHRSAVHQGQWPAQHHRRALAGDPRCDPHGAHLSQIADFPPGSQQEPDRL